MDKAAISKAFFETFGTEPQWVIRAPGRINVIGEHTDYNNGFVLPAAINKAIWMAASKRNDDRFAFYAADLNDYFECSVNEISFQEQQTWANYLLGVIDESQKDGAVYSGLSLAFGGDVPLGAGLSSSAALESGAMYLLNEAFELGWSKMDIVRLAQRGENNFVGMKCGIMDMFASVMGKNGHVLRLDCRDLSYEYFPFEAEGYSLVLLDSGVKHALVDSEYNARRMECEKGAAILQQVDSNIQTLRDVSNSFLEKHVGLLSPNTYKRCKYVVEEISRVGQACEALAENDFEKLGALMFETHQGLDQLYEVSIPEINFLVEQARLNGVTGARMMGGGFGGCTINLVKNSVLDSFCTQTSKAYFQQFNLELKIYPVQLSAGTEVV